MKRFGLKNKLFIGFTFASIFISMMLGFSLFKIASRAYYQSFVESKKALIQHIASAIDGDKHKLLNTPFIFSESLLEESKKVDDLYFRYLGQVYVKGKSIPQKIYELFNADEADQIEKKLKTKDKFELALNLFFTNNFPDSEKLFKEILSINNHDTVCQYYLNQLATQIK